MQILVSGSLAYDRIMDFPGRFADHILPDKIHVLNVSFTVNGLIEKFGGTAGNIAYSLALLGEHPLILATYGRDFDRYRLWLEHNGLPLAGLRPIEGEFTAGAYITTDLADNQITGFNPGAMKHPSLFDFSTLADEETLAIIAAGNLEDMLAYCRACQRLGIPYIFDPGQSLPSQASADLAEMISGARMLISNDYELELIQSATGWDRDQILERCPELITTLGEDGALVATRQSERRVPAVKADPVADPTGAGDAFRAGLIKGLVSGRPLVEAARMGATCAAYAVERYGTQEHHFDQAEFNRRHRAAFG